MDVHVRTQTWISPAPGINEPTANDPEMDEEYNFTEKTLNAFQDPEALRQYRIAIMDRRIQNFHRAMADSDIQLKAQEMFRKSMTGRLGDSPKGKRAAEMLLPTFPVGCRRQTPGPGFLEALLQDNVEMVWDSIQTVTPKGIRFKTGEEAEYDVIVCATGFDTTFKPAFPIIGRNGVNLAEKWTLDQPKAYFGICVPDMPNYFSESIEQNIWSPSRFPLFSSDVIDMSDRFHRPQLTHLQWVLGTWHPGCRHLRVQVAHEAADGGLSLLRCEVRR